MDQILCNTAERIRHAGHIEGLLEKAHFSIFVVSEGVGSWLLKFQGQEIFVETVFDDGYSEAEITINGAEEQLKKLFQGNEFLTTLKNREELSVEGSLRDILTLESLCYLSKNTMVMDQH